MKITRVLNIFLKHELRGEGWWVIERKCIRINCQEKEVGFENEITTLAFFFFFPLCVGINDKKRIELKEESAFNIWLKEVCVSGGATKV